MSIPRLSGTPGRDRAAQYIVDTLTRNGLAVSRMPFVFSTAPIVFLKLAGAIALALVIAAIACWAEHSPLPFVFSVGAFAVVGLASVLVRFVILGNSFDTAQSDGAANAPDAVPHTVPAIAQSRRPSLFLRRLGRSLASRLGKRIRGENIYACLKRECRRAPTARPQTGAVTDGTNARLLLVAHYDSKGQNMSISTRIAMAILGGVGLLFAITLSALNLVPSIAPAADVSGRYHMAFALASCLAFASLLILTTDNSSPGAIDNASGVAVLLDVAARLSAGGALSGTGLEVAFLLTDAEEYALAGAAAFVGGMRAAYDDAAAVASTSERTAAETGGARYRRTFVLNLDGPGAGENYVLFFKRPCGTASADREEGQAWADASDFLRVLNEAAVKESIRMKLRRRLIGAMADHLPFVWEGIPAATLCGMSGTIGLVHTRGDEPARVSEAGMRGAAGFALRVVEEMAARTLPSAVTTRRTSS
ncbi:MAG: M28 family peptidase [Planctomycetota bacterium]|nr:M28 family peptidase [Planctomycetota bacterium]